MNESSTKQKTSIKSTMNYDRANNLSESHNFSNKNVLKFTAQNIEEKNTVLSLQQQILLFCVVVIVYSSCELANHDNNEKYVYRLIAQLVLTSIIATFSLSCYLFKKDSCMTKILKIFIVVKVLLTLIAFLVIESLTRYVLSELVSYKYELSQFYLGIVLFRIFDTDFSSILRRDNLADSLKYLYKFKLVDSQQISIFYLVLDVYLMFVSEIFNVCSILIILFDFYRVSFQIIVLIKTCRTKKSNKYDEIQSQLCQNCSNLVSDFLNNNYNGNKLDIITEEKYISNSQHYSQGNESLDAKNNDNLDLQKINISVEKLKDQNLGGKIFKTLEKSNSDLSNDMSNDLKSFKNSADIKSPDDLNNHFNKTSENPALKSQAQLGVENLAVSIILDEKLLFDSKNHNDRCCLPPNSKIANPPNSCKSLVKVSDEEIAKPNSKYELTDSLCQRQFINTSILLNPEKNKEIGTPTPKEIGLHSTHSRTVKMGLNTNELEASKNHLILKNEKQQKENFTLLCKKSQDQNKNLWFDDKNLIQNTSKKHIDKPQNNLIQSQLLYLTESILSERKMPKNLNHDLHSVREIKRVETKEIENLIEKLKSLPKSLCISRISDILKVINTGIIIFNEKSTLCLSNICELSIKKESTHMLNYTLLEDFEMIYSPYQSSHNGSEPNHLESQLHKEKKSPGDFGTKYSIKNIFKNYTEQKVFISEKNLLDVVNIYNYFKRKNLLNVKDFKSLNLAKRKIDSLDQKGMLDNSLQDIVSNVDIQSKFGSMNEKESQNFANDIRILRGHIYLKELVLLFSILTEHIILSRSKIDINKLNKNFPSMITFYYDELKITMALLDFDSKNIKPTICFLVNSISKEIQNLNLEQKKDFIHLMINSVNHDIRTPQNYLSFNNDEIFEALELQHSNILELDQIIPGENSSKPLNFDKQKLELLITSIRNNHQNILKGVGAISKMVEAIELVLKSVTELTNIDPEKFALQLEQIDLSNCIENVFQLFSDQMNEKGVKDSIMLSTNLIGKKWQTDRKKLEQILSILLNNAIKYSYENTVIQLCVTKVDEDLIQISIRNKCEGLSRDKIEQLESIFNDHLTRIVPENSVGIGLSLRIASALLRYMGKKWYNRLKISSKIKKYVEVTFYIKYFEQSEVNEGGKILNQMFDTHTSLKSVEKITSIKSYPDIFSEFLERKGLTKISCDTKYNEYISKMSSKGFNNTGSMQKSSNEKPNINFFTDNDREIRFNQLLMNVTSPKTELKGFSPSSTFKFTSSLKNDISYMFPGNTKMNGIRNLRNKRKTICYKLNTTPNDSKRRQNSGNSFYKIKSEHINKGITDSEAFIIVEEKISQEDMKSQKSRLKKNEKSIDSLDKHCSFYSNKHVREQTIESHAAISIKSDKDLKNIEKIKTLLKSKTKICGQVSDNRFNSGLQLLKPSQIERNLENNYSGNASNIKESISWLKDTLKNTNSENSMEKNTLKNHSSDKVKKFSSQKYNHISDSKKNSKDNSKSNSRENSRRHQSIDTLNKSIEKYRINLLEISDVEYSSSDSDFKTPTDHLRFASIIDKSIITNELSERKNICFKKIFKQKTKGKSTKRIKSDKIIKTNKKVNKSNGNIVASNEFEIQTSKLLTIKEESSKNISYDNMTKQATIVSPNELLENLRSINSRFYGLGTITSSVNNGLINSNVKNNIEVVNQLNSPRRKSKHQNKFRSHKTFKQKYFIEDAKPGITALPRMVTDKSPGLQMQDLHAVDGKNHHKSITENNKNFEAKKKNFEAKKKNFKENFVEWKSQLEQKIAKEKSSSIPNESLPQNILESNNKSPHFRKLSHYYKKKKPGVISESCNDSVHGDIQMFENYDDLKKQTISIVEEDSKKIIIDTHKSMKKRCCNNILILDDEKLNLLVLKAILRDQNLIIYEGKDGLEGIKIFKDYLNSPEACKECFNFRFILTDLNMPNMDGPTCIEEIMKIIKETGKDLITPRRIVITAYDDDRSKEYCLKKGAEVIQSKPGKKAQILAKLNDMELQ